MFSNWSIAALVAFLIALGLILRYGKDSVGIIGTLSDGINTGIKNLTLSNQPGNA